MLDVERRAFDLLPPMNRPIYKHIAVASTFSPRFMQVLAEAKRVLCRLGQQLSVIFIGEEHEAATQRFRDAFAQLEMNEPRILFEQGDPASALVSSCDKHAVDLIVAGALEKEVVLRPFLGNVARTLVREARCSVFLFTAPAEQPMPFRRIVFMADYTDDGRRALQQTFQLAAAEESERLYVVRVYTSFDEARAARQDTPDARTLEQEEIALERFIDSAGATEVPIEARCIRGNTGYAALDFIQSVEADLLVVPAACGELASHVAWITETIPCNLWVVR